MHYLTGGSMTRQPLLLFLYFTLPVIPYIVGDEVVAVFAPTGMQE
jgi:hypothetical protein